MKKKLKYLINAFMILTMSVLIIFTLQQENELKRKLEFENDECRNHKLFESKYPKFYYLLGSKFEGDKFENKVKSTKFLDLSSSNVTSIAGIECFVNLSALDLSDNLLSDIDLLGQLKTLSELNISNNFIRDIGGLNQLSEMKSLNISVNYIDDISVLKNMPKLKILDMRYNEIEDISVLLNYDLNDFTYVSDSNAYNMNLIQNTILNQEVIDKLIANGVHKFVFANEPIDEYINERYEN
jgi:hypothetical protein